MPPELSAVLRVDVHQSGKNRFICGHIIFVGGIVCDASYDVGAFVIALREVLVSVVGHLSFPLIPDPRDCVSYEESIFQNERTVKQKNNKMKDFL